MAPITDPEQQPDENGLIERVQFFWERLMREVLAAQR
jgi:hypothetical protein